MAPYMCKFCCLYTLSMWGEKVNNQWMGLWCVLGGLSVYMWECIQ